MTGDSNDEAEFPHKLLLTDTQVSRFSKFIANGLSTNLKLSKTQLSKIVQLEKLIFDIPTFGNISWVYLKLEQILLKNSKEVCW